MRWGAFVTVPCFRKENASPRLSGCRMRYVPFTTVPYFRKENASPV